MSFASLFHKKKKEPVVPGARDEERAISGIREVFFRHRSGGSDVRYTLERTDDAIFAKIRLEGESAEDAVTAAVSEDVADEIADLLNTYDVLRWDGYHESERGVLDGDAFTLEVSYGEGESVYADGYMSFPDNFEEVCEGLDEIFRGIRDTALQTE